MKTAFAGAALALAIVWGDSSAQEVEKKANPLIGFWKWGWGSNENVVVEILADGTAKAKYGPATWTEMETKTAVRKYRIAWKKSGIVDEGTLDGDGQYRAPVYG